MARPTCSCGATMEARTLSVVRSVGGRTVTIQSVPALVCPRCDSVMYRATTVRTMDLLIRGNPDKATLMYPEFQDHTPRILIQLSAADPTFSQDPDKPVRRYDVARLRSYIPRLTAITR